MARKTRQRISYVLPLANATAGHRLGVNGLSLDRDRSILYTAGRDGVIYGWDTLRNGLPPTQPGTTPRRPIATYRQHVQAHTHWINDLILVGDNSALVSASSDNSVKLWKPYTEEATPPQTIGLHNDYVKCLASPGRHSPWLASGGLDRKICLWDLNRGGQKLQIQSADEDSGDKGSIYALCVNDVLIASGGPESTVKIWDARSGKRITNFVGHTDNIRSILISQDSDTIMTASSDQTVKVWSMAAGRCVSTLTMHNDSVWSLYSNHPQLSVFYSGMLNELARLRNWSDLEIITDHHREIANISSGDRAGFVAKTDTRGALDLDEGMSVALCQEHGGVGKIVTSERSLWTATASSSVNMWADVDTSGGVQIPESMRNYRLGSTSRSRLPVSSSPPSQSSSVSSAGSKIPLKSLLRMSNTATYPPLQARSQTDRSASQQTIHGRKASVTVADSEIGPFEPLRNQPEGTIEGQIGLIKHVMLNDKRRVLTLDTAGEVVMWDLLKCMPLKSFGKRHIEDVVLEVNTTETVAHWCAVDTRTGTLTCVLEAHYCFDAEMYADELKEADVIAFKEDQRINLGKWVLRYLFAGLLDEELRRDEQFRSGLQTMKRSDATKKPTLSIQLPNSELDGSNDSSQTTPRASNGRVPFMMTPGLSIGAATPGGAALLGSGGRISNPLAIPMTSSTLGDSQSAKASLDQPMDYFTSRPQTPALSTPGTANAATPRIPATPSEAGEDKVPLSPCEPDKAKGTSLKRLRMSFTGKKLGRSAIETPKTPISNVVESDSESSSSKAGEPVYEDLFQGTVQRIRNEYKSNEADFDEPIKTLITPGLPNELPVLKPPFTTVVIIQEESPDSAGVQDLYEGNIGSLGRHADKIERVAPIWLADALLLNRIPVKDIVKVSFILEPFDKSLPSITTFDGTDRLNANRMLRARKILSYVAERLETHAKAVEADSENLRPEEFLEIHCQNQRIPPKMTLATIRTHIWRGGGDVVLVYKANGRQRYTFPPPRTPTPMRTTDAA